MGGIQHHMGRHRHNMCSSPPLGDRAAAATKGSARVSATAKTAASRGDKTEAATKGTARATTDGSSEPGLRVL